MAKATSKNTTRHGAGGTSTPADRETRDLQLFFALSCQIDDLKAERDTQRETMPGRFWNMTRDGGPDPRHAPAELLDMAADEFVDYHAAYIRAGLGRTEDRLCTLMDRRFKIGNRLRGWTA